ncbi:hypothetical protein FSP39_003201 [Pinctada imbricata]|uniref:Dynamin N-terminal domain-containing protein n=1 Tax=Pinctada imbricata TaxID=66713 RepID=A0AA88YPM9_PINIB|nr:hypothetical protein FSP39_003201 [Pinctada imbricata]
MAGARPEIGKSMAPHLLTTTVSSDCEYTPEDIRQVTEFEDAFEMGEDMGVDMRGLDELDETKQRLIMHIEKKEGSNYKQEVAQDLVNVSKDDVKKKKKLIDLLDKFQEELEQFTVEEDQTQKHGKRGSAAIESLLKTEGATSNLEIDFQQKIQRTKNNECLVVVSGETSAGKSSVLNLLIGEKILPVHHNPCTSVITRISYGKQRTAKIVFRDGRLSSLEDLDGKDKWKTLWDQIYVKDENERELATEVKEIRIFVPAILLKCGLVLVDSPGIGENDAMDEVITAFVEENDIMGFLYIVKSDNAGGVDEDRLGSLLKVIMEKQKKKTEGGSTTPFDPKCAIFVCNMWDLVKEHERKLVFDYAVTKLGLYWPGLTETQVVTMSTRKCQREVDVDPQYILPEYKQFLDDMKELFVKALDRRIKTTYKWLENILVRSVHHLKIIVRRIDNSEEDLATTMKNVHSKLTRLKEHSHDFIQTQRIKLDTESKEITRAFKEELIKPQVKFRICQWIDGETPVDDDWDTIKHMSKKWF